MTTTVTSRRGGGGGGGGDETENTKTKQTQNNNKTIRTANEVTNKQTNHCTTTSRVAQCRYIKPEMVSDSDRGRGSTFLAVYLTQVRNVLT